MAGVTRSSLAIVCHGAAAVALMLLGAAPAIGGGTVTPHTVHSATYARARQVWVYTPEGYSARGAPDDLLLAFDGGEYLETIPLPHILDSLIAARRIPPMVAVLIDDSTSTVRLDDLANQPRFVTFMTRELLPWVRARWHVTTDPAHTTVTGSSAGGLASAYLALQRPDLFGNVLSQSGAFWRGNQGSNSAPFEWLTGRYRAAPRRDLHFVLDVGALETRGAIGGTAPSILDANRRLHEVLRAKGYPVAYTEVPNAGHAPEFWRERLAGDLVTMVSSRRR